MTGWYDAEPWMADALCVQTDPEAFFPGPHDEAREAKRVCRNCPVLTNCHAYALWRPELEGIWGGTSANARIRLRVQLRKEHPGLTLDAEPDHDAA